MLRILNSLRKLNRLNSFNTDLTYSCYQNVPRAFSTTSCSLAKTFVDRENAYCYGIVAPLYEPTKIPILEILFDDFGQITTHESFKEVLNQDFKQKSTFEIVSTFEKVLPFCKANEITLSDTTFDKLIDALLNNAETLQDSELIKLLDLIIQFPPCSSIEAHNYHDLWSCLDDICCWRIPNWDYNMLFAISERWFKLGLGKVSDFIFEAIDKMSRKPELRLTKSQLVNAFFLMNVTRKRQVHFEYEYALDKCVHEMSVDELAIVALGYFKTQSKVKIPAILIEMLEKAQSAPILHEITLCAILKTIRYTSCPNLAVQIIDFLNYITPKLEQYSTLCVLHAGLLGTTLQLLHTPSLDYAAQRIASCITDVNAVRLKDIERLLLALTMFDYDPKTTPCIYKVAMDELHHERRQRELIMHPRCLGAAISYLAIRNMYSKELLERVLNNEFINEVYGKSAKMYPRELFVLDTNIDIEVEDYQGQRLELVKRRKITKWLTAFSPVAGQNYKITAVDKLILDVQLEIERIVGCKENIYVDHVLPQYLRADLILCRNKTTKQFVKPQGFENYELGDIMRPQPQLCEEFDFIAMVIVGWNNTIRHTTIPVGVVNMKMRHLRKIGFKPATVVWNEYSQFNGNNKRKYLQEKINTCIKS